MPYCMTSSNASGRFLRITLRTALIASRRSGGKALRYWSTVLALLCTTMSSLLQSLRFDGIHRREIADDGRPAIAAIGRPVHLPAGGAEIYSARIECIDGRCVAQDVDIAILLRQTFGERLPVVAARLAAVDAQLAIRHKVLRVALDREDEHRIRLVGVNLDGKPEIGRQVAADFLPRIAGIVRAHYI